MATNRADTLDPALLRPGRLDRKIEFPMPSRRERRLIFQTCTGKMNLGPDVDLEDCQCLSVGTSNTITDAAHYTFVHPQTSPGQIVSPLLKLPPLFKQLVSKVSTVPLYYAKHCSLTHTS